MAEGNLYLSIFIDLYTRKIVGYSLDKHIRTSLITQNLERDIKYENPKEGLIVHTYQGTQYMSHDYLHVITNNHFINSYSDKGNQYDNAVIESFFKSFKREVLLKKYFKTKALTKLEILNNIKVYYNKKGAIHN
ncbi:Integrase core domain [Acholeplasma oculi]|uniref:Integrase n=1 Tax=Acholeplasma oculi TaxID=35623 RepID=A0A061AAJ7_9MOLU|nr:DDE-type integrase/transposase/recombinase [Acholeplasma oculi]CDR30925.1 Integrase [Acholeplasma oculi]SUT90178.1 Integrase core domain [Acholeplasma oculi]